MIAMTSGHLCPVGEMRRARISLLLAAGLIHGCATSAVGDAVVAEAPPPAATAAPEKIRKAETYVHPVRKYTLSIPPGVQVAERGEKREVAIRSRQGYRISIQTKAANPGASFQDMIARLEAHYLGPGRAWSRKLGEGPMTVAGMPAYQTLYEGSGTRTGVVVVRGRITDFVFMFFAPPRDFDALKREFDWLLDNFQPAAGEVAVKNAPSLQATVPPPEAPGKSGRRHFADPKFGFSIDYPADWIVAKPSPFTVIFRGREGTDAFYATIGIRNVRSSSAAGQRQVVAAVLSDLKAQLAAAATAVEYFGDRPLTYDKNGLRLEGHEFLVTYTMEEERFRQWTIIIPRPKGEIAHVWSYASSEARFHFFRPVVEAMWKSWIIRAAGE